MKYTVHLHTHSVFTKGNSTLEVEDLVLKSKEFGMTTTALVDSGNIDGFEIFTKFCQKYAIRPIYGCGFYHISGSRFEQSGKRDHLVLLVKKQTGMENLKILVEKSFSEGFFNGKPHIDDDLLKTYSDGLICMTGGLGGELDKLIVADKYEEAKSRAQFYFSLFNEDFYLELQDHGLEKNRQAMAGLCQISEELNLPTVATQGSFYLNQSDSEGCNKLRKENGNNPLKSDQFYYKSPGKMEELFLDYPQALANISKIIEKIGYHA